MAGKQNDMAQSALATVGQALDQGAWLNLCSANPPLAQAVAAAVEQGVTPAAIRQFVVRHTAGKAELASFVEQAARWLAAQADA